jgi:hypothetical protein
MQCTCSLLRTLRYQALYLKKLGNWGKQEKKQVHTVVILVVLATRNDSVTTYSCIVSVTSIQMRGCDGTESNPLDLIENADTVITCDNIQGTDKSVTWSRYQLPPTNIIAGTCSSDLVCTPRDTNAATLSRSTYSSSSMTIKNPSRALYTGSGIQVTCHADPAADIDSCYVTMICKYSRVGFICVQ